MRMLWQDLRFGARILLKKPGYTLIAVVTLALGLGANSAMFSLIDALLFRPLPFKNMDRLAVVWRTLPHVEVERRLQTSPASYLDFREQQQVFEQLAAYHWQELNLTGIGKPERLHGFAVTQNLFPALGVNLVHGRLFQPEEEAPGKDDVVMLSEGLWKRRFAVDPAIIGQNISLNGRSYAVVGIIADGYEWPQGAELWVPLALTTEMRSDRARHYLDIVGLLKPGVTMEQARQEMERIAGRIAELHPDTEKGRGVNLLRLPGKAADDYLRQLGALLAGGVVFVLLIACVNVANLQLVQASSRQKEIAIRAAVGASRGSLIRLLLTESMLLSLAGALLGLLIAPWVIDYAKVSLPPDIRQFLPVLKHAEINLRTLGYTTILGLLSGVVAGLAPSLHASKVNLVESLKEGGRSVAGAARHGLRGALVVVEVALALVMLIGTGLMVRGFTISVLATWMAGLGLLALALAAVGVYGVMAYAVAQRTNEIGIRIALGARPLDIIRLMLGQGLKLVAAGVAAGLIAAYALGHALAGRLYGVNATDPMTFVLVALGLIVIGLLACWIPARRAARVDPMVALRVE